MELAVYIADLLKQHNCVIVPNFGGFIANYKSASVDTNRKQIKPPEKSILFNANLVINDGLLSNTISQTAKISYPDALVFIQRQVEKWKNDLTAGTRVEIEEIGFLYRENGKIVFEQSREVNLLLSAYGLSAVSFINFTQEKEAIKETEVTTTPIVVAVEEKIKPTAEVPVIALNTAAKIEEVAEETTEKETVKLPQKRKKNTWKYIAAAAAIALVFYSYWIPVETDYLNTGNIQFADFNPLSNTPERTYQPLERSINAPRTIEWKSWEELTDNLSENVSVYNYQFTDQLYIPVLLDELKVEETTVPTAETNAVFAENNSGTPYHVIGGCFSVKSNAEQLVKDLNEQGFSASILDFHKGLYRVSAGDYTSRTVAKSNLKDFKNDGFSGWILKK